mmetsp:Transcript_3529/g.7595  ORF Transcript_3529/g.7595 Transcript_3529/m.7595 type:complete len:207 (-) Transcript_3529:736-1356(-)
MLLPGWEIPIGIKSVGILKGRIKSHRYCRRNSYDVVLGNVMGLSVHGNSGVFHNLPQQHDERGAHTKCFAHAVVQHTHLLDVVEFQDLLASELFLLFHDTFQNLGVVKKQQQGPGTGYARGVLPRKQQSNQQTSDFFLCHKGTILVFHVHKQTQDIGSIGSFGIFSTFLYDFTKELHEFLSGGVTLLVPGRWGGTPQNSQWGQTFV